jgi:deoxyinosine 3'endonuclease (endonuclease V)
VDKPSKERLGLLALEQIELSEMVEAVELEHEAELVAGVDVSYVGGVAFSAAVVMDESLEVLELSTAETRVEFPYVPGFFSYRELRPAVNALQGLSGYDVLMVNGHGLAHLRGFGLASHIGVELRKPTIGVARRLLCGELDDPCADETLIKHGGKVIGAKMTSPTGSPVYVSVGHLITLGSCVEIVDAYFLDRSLPEPLAAAHSYSVDLSRLR